MPAAPERWPINTVLPWLMLAVPLIWPTANGGASQAVWITPLFSFRRGMSTDMTGPGRGVGASVDGLSTAPTVSPLSSRTLIDGAGVPSPMAVTCSSKDAVAPGFSGGKLNVRRPAASVRSSETAGPLPMML